jgi:hypothetical protein
VPGCPVAEDQPLAHGATSTRVARAAAPGALRRRNSSSRRT